jgi:histidinol-phosphate phosphatase family protein
VFQISTNSCLFLDRDGVINKRLINDYVKNWDEFIFLPGTIQALQILQRHFSTIVIVTNQQGIAKGLYTEKDLEIIHQKMLEEFQQNQIHIDAVFYSPNLASENSPLRKPNIGMALKTKELFTHIHLEESIMVGDSLSDMHFGKNAGMKTVFIDENETTNYNLDVIDTTFKSLLHFATYLTGHDDK